MAAPKGTCNDVFEQHPLVKYRTFEGDQLGDIQWMNILVVSF